MNEQRKRKDRRKLWSKKFKFFKRGKEEKTESNMDRSSGMKENIPRGECTFELVVNCLINF